MNFWQVDAFTNKIFGGNPAAVFIFDEEAFERSHAENCQGDEPF